VMSPERIITSPPFIQRRLPPRTFASARPFMVMSCIVSFGCNPPSRGFNLCRYTICYFVKNSCVMFKYLSFMADNM